MTQNTQTLKAEIISALDALPLESLTLLSEFVAFLRSKTEQPKPQMIKLGGLWSETPEITTEDITEARREMWANFGEREL